MNPTQQNQVSGEMRAVSVIPLLAGIWLFFSPWIYGAYGSSTSWNSWIVGVVIALLAASRLASSTPSTWMSWINCLLGIWTFISPWVYGYTDMRGRFINSLCVGVIVFVVAARNAMSTPHRRHPHPPQPTMGSM